MNRKPKTCLRCGSRIDTDRFPKRAPKLQASRKEGGGGGGSAACSRLGNFLDFNSPKSPGFQGFWVIQTGYWPDLSLESFIFITIYLFIKNLTDFRKTVETCVDPHLCLVMNLYVSFFLWLIHVYICVVDIESPPRSCCLMLSERR